MSWIRITKNFKYKSLRGTQESSEKLFQKFKMENPVRSVTLPGSMTANRLRRFLPSDYSINTSTSHPTFRTSDLRFRIFDHIEVYKTEDKGENILVSHPYALQNSEKYPLFTSDGTPTDETRHALFGVQDLLNFTGYDFLLVDSKWDWYYPNSTALIILKNPETAVFFDDILIYGKRKKLSLIEWIDLQYQAFQTRIKIWVEFDIANNIPYEIAKSENFGTLATFALEKYGAKGFNHMRKIYEEWVRYNESVDIADKQRKQALERVTHERQFAHLPPFDQKGGNQNGF